MKNQNRSDYTIQFTSKALITISKQADLNNPEQVKQFIANLQTSNGYKKNLCLAYKKFCKYYQIRWQMPIYKPQAKTIKIPTKEKIEMLTASSGKILSLKLTISKETGLRPIELCNLKAKDVDIDQKIIYPTTAKHGAPRALKISNSLQTTLQNHINTNKLNLNDKLFKGTAEDYGKHYRAMRNSLATKLSKPELKTIRLYDFRHYFATHAIRKNKRHSSSQITIRTQKNRNNPIYTQLLNLNEDEWTCKTVTNLIENGFEYIQEIDGIRLYRKRK